MHQNEAQVDSSPVRHHARRGFHFIGQSRACDDRANGMTLEFSHTRIQRMMDSDSWQ
jgi:hypothetical protein